MNRGYSRIRRASRRGAAGKVHGAVGELLRRESPRESPRGPPHGTSDTIPDPDAPPRHVNMSSQQPCRRIKSSRFGLWLAYLCLIQSPARLEKSVGTAERNRPDRGVAYGPILERLAVTLQRLAWRGLVRVAYRPPQGSQEGHLGVPEPCGADPLVRAGATWRG